jgi:uncharacterized protein
MMTYDVSTPCVAFVGATLLASGRLDEVVAIAKAAFDKDSALSPWVFDATTSARIDIDLGGSREQVNARLPQAPHPPVRGPGRPKLGVVAREVTLLPRHWEWLSTQQGGASVALRKLVEQARKTGSSADDRRKGQEAAYKFMTAIGGDYIGYEDATRALFAGEGTKFMALIDVWPKDVRAHLERLGQAAFRREDADVQWK